MLWTTVYYTHHKKGLQEYLLDGVDDLAFLGPPREVVMCYATSILNWIRFAEFG